MKLWLSFIQFGTQLLILVSHDALDFGSVTCNLFFISNFIDLKTLAFFFLMSLAKGFQFLFLFKEPTFGFVDFLY